MNDQIMVTLLLRKESADLIEGLKEIAPKKGLFCVFEGRPCPFSKIRSVIVDTVAGQTHFPSQWSMRCSAGQANEHALFTDVESILNLEGWLLTKWGSSYTGLMLLLWCRRSVLLQLLNRNRSLERFVVNIYDQKDVKKRLFHGAIFWRDPGQRAAGIWCSAVANSTAKALIVDPPDEQLDLTRICSVNWREFGVARASWIRLSNEQDFLFWARHEDRTGLIVAADVDDAQLKNCLAQVALEGVKNDPLKIGLALKKMTSWIYIPSTVRERNEILLHNNVEELAAILQSDAVRSSESFAVDCWF